LDVIKGFIRDHGVTAGMVEKLIIRMTTADLIHVGWEYKPESITTAQLNLPYCAAAMLVEGDCFVDQFTEEKIKDPRILAVIPKIEVSADPELDALGLEYRHAAKVEMQLNDGRVLSRRNDYAKGFYKNPMSREEFINKFRALASKVVDSQRVEAIEEAVLNMERLESASELARLLTLAPVPSSAQL